MRRFREGEFGASDMRRFRGKKSKIKIVKFGKLGDFS